MSSENVFKEAGKAATKIRHLNAKRDAAIARASGSCGLALIALLREVGPDVAKALVHQGIVHEGQASHAFSFCENAPVVMQHVGEGGAVPDVGPIETP